MDEQVTRSLVEEREEVRPRVRRPRRRWGRILLALVLVALVGYGLYRVIAPTHRAADAPGTGSRSGQMPPQSVGAATIGRGDIRVILNALGTVTPLTTVTVRTQINGLLQQIAFKEGQVVQKGDFLAQIDPRPYQVTLESGEGALARDQALLRNAQLDLQRYQTLVKQDSIAKQTLDTQAALVQQYAGTVKTDQATIDTAKLNLVYCHITAPATGRVGLRQVDEGNYVQASDANGIVVLTQLQPISVVFSLPEDNVPEIVQQAPNGAGLPVMAYDRADLQQLAKGKIETIDNQVDTTTGTVKLRALFDNSDNALFPNQFVNAKLVVETKRGVVVAPTTAIQRGEPGTFVYAIRPDNTVHVQPVKLGPTDGDKVMIESGLNEGDRVVTDGADRLREGAQVIVPQAGNGDAGRQQAGPQGAAPGPAQDSAQGGHRHGGHGRQQDQQ